MEAINNFSVSIRDFALVLTSISTVALTLIAFFQLRSLIKGNTLKIVFDIEREINQHKILMDAAIAEVQIKLLEQDNEKLDDILEGKMNAALENYLNSLDRLAFLILKKYVPEREWRKEYYNLVVDTVKQHEDKFGPATLYANIEKLYRKWKE